MHEKFNIPLRRTKTNINEDSKSSMEKSLEKNMLSAAANAAATAAMVASAAKGVSGLATITDADTGDETELLESSRSLRKENNTIKQRININTRGKARKVPSAINGHGNAGNAKAIGDCINGNDDYTQMNHLNAHICSDYNDDLNHVHNHSINHDFHHNYHNHFFSNNHENYNHLHDHRRQNHLHAIADYHSNKSNGNNINTHLNGIKQRIGVGNENSNHNIVAIIEDNNKHPNTNPLKTITIAQRIDQGDGDVCRDLNERYMIQPGRVAAPGNAIMIGGPVISTITPNAMATLKQSEKERIVTDAYNEENDDDEVEEVEEEEDKRSDDAYSGLNPDDTEDNTDDVDKDEMDHLRDLDTIAEIINTRHREKDQYKKLPTNFDYEDGDQDEEKEEVEEDTVSSSSGSENSVVRNRFSYTNSLIYIFVSFVGL